MVAPVVEVVAPVSVLALPVLPAPVVSAELEVLALDLRWCFFLWVLCVLVVVEVPVWSDVVPVVEALPSWPLATEPDVEAVPA